MEEPDIGADGVKPPRLHQLSLWSAARPKVVRSRLVQYRWLGSGCGRETRGTAWHYCREGADL